MEPETVGATDRGKLRNRIDAGGRGRADGGDNAEGSPALSKIFADRLLQGVGVQAEGGVDRYFAHPLLADAKGNGRFLD